MENLSHAQRKMKNALNETCKQGEEILQMIDTVKKKIAELEAIALQPRIFSTVDYFTEMIHQEKMIQKEGWQERVHGFQIIKKRAEALNELQRSSDAVITDPYGVAAELLYQLIEDVTAKMKEMEREHEIQVHEMTKEDSETDDKNQVHEMVIKIQLHEVVTKNYRPCRIF